LRRWRRGGVLEVERPRQIRDDPDARRAGQPDRDALLAGLPGDGALHRIEFRLAGPDPRIALRERSRISLGERDEIDARLARLDAASRHGPWTATVLGLIAERPATRAPDLAASLGRETVHFKADVRKLKELGLTESLEVGYRLSPRGRAYYGYSGVARKRSRSR